MMKHFSIAAALVCCGILCATPYGRALQQARKVANRPHPAEQVMRAPERKQAPAEDFGKLWLQMGGVIKQNRGFLPGPAGVAGLRKICGPGKISPALLKINDFGKLTERNCSWAYVGGSLGVLQKLPGSGEFPILFAKPRPGVHQIKVLMADGKVKLVDARRISSCSGVVNALRRSSVNAKHPIWKKLSTAASQIDKASR